MKPAIVQYINPIMVVVFTAFIIGLFLLQPKKTNHRFVGAVLFICFFTEIIALLLKVIHKQQYILLLYDISFFLFLSVWLFALLYNMAIMKNGKWLIFLFGLFAIANFSFIQGSTVLNYYTFVFGSLIYIVTYFWKSIVYLKQLNFRFFFSNANILLIAPLTLLFGLSFMFVFVKSSITNVIIFGKTTLYELVCLYINIIFYGLLIVYMIREKRFRNE